MTKRTALAPAARDTADAVDADALTRELAELVRIRSVTGDEEDIAADLVGRLEALGLAVEVFHPNPAVFRDDPDWPGEETERSLLPVVIGRLGRPAGDGGSSQGTWTSCRRAIPATWTTDPWGGAVRDGRLSAAARAT